MKKPIFLFFVIMWLLFCLVYGFQKQQKLLPPERHVVKVRLVLVDVIVKKGGEFVTDLKKEDFELFEDEKKIPINSCDLISFGKRELVTLEEKPEEVSPPPAPKKQLVVVFDGVSSWQRKLKEGARKIVDELVSLAKLGHEVMVIQLSEKLGLEVIQPFTTEEELIRKALIRASIGVWYDDSLAALEMWQEAGFENVGEMAQVERYIERLQPTLQREYLYREKGRFEKAVGGIFAVANMIKDLPGRKSILLISDGFPDLSSEDRRIEVGQVRIFDPFNILERKKNMTGDQVIRELIRFANAQNISIYSLDPDTFTRYFFKSMAHSVPALVRPDSVQHDVGVIKDTHTSGFQEREKMMRVQNLEWISKDTGAVSLRGARKYDRFKQVMKTDLNYYYQLSYYPPRKEADNKYHKIKVKVKRRGVNVRFRKGYTDYSENEEDKMLLVSAFYNPSSFKELPFKAEFIPFFVGTKKYEPWMGVALPARELFSDTVVEFGLKKFTLHVWIKDKKRGESAFGGQINIPLNIDSSFMDSIKTIDYLCFHYRGPELPFPHQEYQAIFALRDPQTNEVGTWQAPLSLPDFKEKQGAVINCVLGFIASNPKKGRNLFSVSQKDGSLEYGQIKFFPSVTNRFQRMQDASVFLQIYLPQGKDDLQPKFTISSTASQTGRRTQLILGELVAESWNMKSKVWNALFNLDLKNVIFGDYTLEVEIPVTKGDVLSREVKLTKLRY